MGMLFELRIVLYLFRCDGSTVGHWYGFIVFGLCFFILSAQYSLGYFNFKAFAEKNVFKELNKQILFNHFHSRHPPFSTSPSPSTTPCPISSPSTSPQPNIISQCSPHKPNYFAGLPAGEFTSGFGPFSPRRSELFSCWLTRSPNCSTSSYRGHAWSRLSGSCAATARRCFGALEKCQSTLPDLSDRQLGKLLFMATLFNIRSMRWGWAYVSPVPCTSAPSRPTRHDSLLHIRRLSFSRHHSLFGPILRGTHSCCAAARI